MIKSTIFDCKIINFKKKISNLSIENNIDIPFEIKRIYYMYNINNQSIRGEHAHKNLFQLVIGLNDGLKIKIDDAQNKKSFNLKKANQGLLIVPGIWRTLTNFSSESICLVLASELYSEEDYIRNYNEFLIYKNDTS